MSMLKKWSRVIVFPSLLLSAFSAVAEPLDDLSGGQTGRIEFQASNPPSREALIQDRLGPQVTIWGDLLMPTKKVEGKVPAVIFSHGSEGVSRMYFDVYAKALNDAGYAVFVVDSFKPRGEDKIAGSNKQFTWNTTLNISDALYALKLLAKHPQIDKDRIFHMGWSRGASAVLAAAWPTYQQNILPLDVKWAGSIAIYPGCNFRFGVDRHSSLPSPMLMLLAEKDDMTPAPPCVEYAQALAAKGHQVSYKVYPGAYHVFDWLNQPWRKYIGYPYRNCNLDVPQPYGPSDSMKWAPIFNRDTGTWIKTQEEHKAYLAVCAKPDYITTESNPKAREQAVKDVLAFLLNPK